MSDSNISERGHVISNHAERMSSLAGMLLGHARALDRELTELEASNRALSVARDENSAMITRLRSRVWDLEAEIKTLREATEEQASTDSPGDASPLDDSSIPF